MKMLPLVMTAFVVLGCSARRSEPIRGRSRINDAQVASGRMVFMKFCHQCHPGGEAGLGPALNNKALPGALIALQVRVGLGAMPSFSQADIDENQLGDLIRYLKALRRKSF